MRSSEASDCVPLRDLENWCSHPNLLFHSRRFAAHCDKSKVLQRYSTCESQGPLLMRHIRHVAAWVALLPLEDVARDFGFATLSPVSVLIKLLQLRGRAKVPGGVFSDVLSVHSYISNFREPNYKQIPNWFYINKAQISTLAHFSSS